VHHEFPDRADRLTIAVAQLNPTVGDLAGNAREGGAGRARPDAQRDGADLVAFPELFIAGLSARGSRAQAGFFRPACRARVEELAARRPPTAARPCSSARPGSPDDGKLYNAYCLLDQGRDRSRSLQGSICQTMACSTRSGVFVPGPLPGPIRVPRRAHRHSDLRGLSGARTVVECLAETGAELMIVPNGLAILAQERRRAPSISRWRAVTESGLPAHLHQPGRRPGRARVRWSVPSVSTSTARLGFQLAAFP